MNKIIIVNALRFVILILLQALVLRRITFEWNNLAIIHIMIYPLFILLLPIKTPRVLSVILAFLMGISIDIFYDSLGIHASALLFTAYIRSLILKIMEPFGGYNVEDSPTLDTMGMGWFTSYSATLLIIHIFFYFSVEAFSFVFIFEIVLNTIFSFIASILIILVSQIIIRGKY